jgi:hypothetical protein
MMLERGVTMASRDEQERKEQSKNENEVEVIGDPTLFVTFFHRRKFGLFSTRAPSDSSNTTTTTTTTSSGNSSYELLNGRDVLNELPTEEERQALRMSSVLSSS